MTEHSPSRPRRSPGRRRLHEDIARIWEAARPGPATEQRCMVAPSPKAWEKIRKELAKARNAVAPGVAAVLRVRDPRRPGFNDGMLYPGSHFPPGTPMRSIRSAAARRAPLRGDLNVVVVLVQFSDRALEAAHDAAHFENLFFSEGVIATGSVREYFTEATNGLVRITGQVVGPYTLPLPLADYAHGESGIGNAAPNSRNMAEDAAEEADPDVDFGAYDNDGDGFVDAFVVVHAGRGAEETLSPDDIWSHKWVLPSAYDGDGKEIFAYLTVPEDARIGVCCHELGHLLFGFPDLYDIDDSSAGIGNWCLMGSGSWLGNGDRPGHPSAWCKADQEWATVVNQTTTQVVSIADVKDTHTVYRLWKDGAPGSEYFLVENRQKSQFDEHLPGEGLLIWHVDEAVSTNEDETHPKVKLLQADGAEDLEAGNDRGDAGDPYPGSAGNNRFASTTTPNSNSYAGVDTCVSVSNISASGATMTARLQVSCKSKEKEKEKEKEWKEIKEKEWKEPKELKEWKERKEKDWKDKEWKERKEKDIGEPKGIWEPKSFDEKGFFEDKRPEKPDIDKSAAYDKAGVIEDKPFDKPGDGGWDLPGGGWEGADAQTGRAASGRGPAPARPPGPEPFIARGERPDLRDSALRYEEDVRRARAKLREGAATAKRELDAKPRED